MFFTVMNQTIEVNSLPVPTLALHLSRPNPRKYPRDSALTLVPVVRLPRPLSALSSIWGSPSSKLKLK
jgi:hypothetical protein